MDSSSTKTYLNLKRDPEILNLCLECLNYKHGILSVDVVLKIGLGLEKLRS